MLYGRKRIYFINPDNITALNDDLKPDFVGRDTPYFNNADSILKA